MGRTSSLFAGAWLLLLLLLPLLQSVSGITVELSEVQRIGDGKTFGEFDFPWYREFLDDEFFGGVDPLDGDCPNSGRCVGLLTRDGSLELDSRYGCTEPSGPPSDDSASPESTCCVSLGLSTSTSVTSAIASVKVALHPDSTTALTVRADGETVLERWEASPGSTELQEIPGLGGIETYDLTICGAFGAGDYLAILEVEIYVTVDEVPIVGTSANTRVTVSATATTDSSSVMNTLDGDTTDSSSWTCSSGEVCEVTYDLQAPESLEQLRVAFSESSDPGGQLNFMTAGVSGMFSSVRTGIEAGGRPVASDGLQTFGGVRALARYVKIEVIPPDGGSVVITEVDFRIGVNIPTRPVGENKWLKPTGLLPLSDARVYDSRTAVDGGCDSPAQFQGCHVYYVKDGDMDSRWACGPLAAGDRHSAYDYCDLGVGLNYFRYVRQIQIAFHRGDEHHDEFGIEALTAQGWMKVVGSAITSGDTTDYQTFDVGVHASVIKVVPKFQKVNQWFSINEIIVLERKNDFIAGTVPVLTLYETFEDDGGDGDDYNDDYYDDDDEPVSEVDIPTTFKFDIPSEDDFIRIFVVSSTVTGLRMRFPADRTFVFEVDYEFGAPSETFTSAGGDKVWEAFTFSRGAAVVWELTITAVSGPQLSSFPDYPALRVVDFQVVGEVEDSGPGVFRIVSTTLPDWGTIPDIIGDGVSEQETIMTVICETKGARFDGVDCIGELDDSTVHIEFGLGEYYLDGPIFMKSGVTLCGVFNSEFNSFTDFVIYEGANTGKTTEDAVIVFDNVTGAEMENIIIYRHEDWTGDIVPGTIGNLCLDVRNSKDLYFYDIDPRECRTGAARFVDSSNISAVRLQDSKHETGNYMELTRVDDFRIDAFPYMGGLLVDTCNNIIFEGAIAGGLQCPTAWLGPPVGGDQTANVVIAGNSSNVVFRHCRIGPGAEPRITMESPLSLTLDNIVEYEEAEAGDCIVGVPAGTADDLIVQTNSNQNLSKSGDCWVLD